MNPAPEESIEQQLDKIITDIKTNNEIIEEIAEDAARLKEKEDNKKE